MRRYRKNKFITYFALNLHGNETYLVSLTNRPPLPHVVMNPVTAHFLPILNVSVLTTANNACNKNAYYEELEMMVVSLQFGDMTGGKNFISNFCHCCL